MHQHTWVVWVLFSPVWNTLLRDGVVPFEKLLALDAAFRTASGDCVACAWPVMSSLWCGCVPLWTLLPQCMSNTCPAVLEPIESYFFGEQFRLQFLFLFVGCICSCNSVMTIPHLPSNHSLLWSLGMMPSGRSGHPSLS